MSSKDTASSSTSSDSVHITIDTYDPMEGPSNALDPVKVKPRMDIFNIFKTLASYARLSNNGEDTGESEPVLSFSELVDFVKYIQKMDCKDEYARDLIKKYETNPKVSGRDCMSIEGLSKYLLAKENNAFSPSPPKVNKADMNHPLSCYFIASSFSKQKCEDSGQAFEDIFITALESGCRHLEMDCWDRDAVYPSITTGPDSTRKGSFFEVLQAINMSAFATSPYPVLLSVGIYCSAKQQAKMKEAFEVVFGDKLVEGFMIDGPEYREPLPSPEQLKYKILIQKKNREISLDVDGTQGINRFLNCCWSSRSGSSLSSDSSCSDDNYDSDVNGVDVLNTYDESDGNFGDDEGDAVAIADDDFKQALDEIAKFQSDGWACSQCSLIRKDKIMNLLKLTETKLVNVFPSRHYMDEYYNPLLFWSSGCQMIGCDYQNTNSQLLHMNEAFFNLNGGCGYLLKPAWMRDPSHPAYRQLNPRDRILESVLATQLCVSIVSEHSFSKMSASGVYVTITIIDMPQDRVTKRTPTMKNGVRDARGWMANELYCFNIPLPELTFIRFAVLDAATNLELCHRVEPFVNIQPGIRHMSMWKTQDATLTSENLIVYNYTEKVSPGEQSPFGYDDDYRVYSMDVYENDSEQPCANVFVTSETTAAQVIALVLETRNEPLADVTQYILVEELSNDTEPGKYAERKVWKQGDPTLYRRVMDGNERPVELQAARTCDGFFVLEKIQQDSYSAMVVSTDQGVGPTTHLIGLCDVDPKTLSIRVELNEKTTARDARDQTLTRAKVNGPFDEFVLLEVLKYSDSNITIRMFDDDELVLATVSKWVVQGKFAVRKREKVETKKTGWFRLLPFKQKKCKVLQAEVLGDKDLSFEKNVCFVVRCFIILVTIAIACCNIIYF